MGGGDLGIGKSHGAQTQPLGSEDVQGQREKALDSQKGNVKHTPVCEAVRARIGAGEKESVGWGISTLGTWRTF